MAPHLPSFNLVTLYEASFRFSSPVKHSLNPTKERDAADRSCYPLTIDQDRSTSINFAKSINFSMSQKIRTQRRCLETTPDDGVTCSEQASFAGHGRTVRSHALMMRFSASCGTVRAFESSIECARPSHAK
jgi:hypothetical protein